MSTCHRLLVAIGLTASLACVLSGAPPEPGVPKAPPPRKSIRLDQYGDPLPSGAVARLGKRGVPSAVVSWGVAFSPDGRLLAASCLMDRGSEIRLWDVKTLKEVRVLREPRVYTRAIGFSPDSKLLATSSGDNTLFVWDLRTGKAFFKKQGIPNLGRGLSLVVFSPDGKTMVSPALAGIHKTPLGVHPGLRLWETVSGQERGALNAPEPQGILTSVAFSPRGRLLALGTNMGNVHIYDLARRRNVRTFGRFLGPVNAIFFSSDGTIIWAVADDQGGGKKPETIRCWEVGSGKELWRAGGPCQIERRAVLLPNEAALATINFCDGAAYIWDGKSGKQLGKLLGHRHQVGALAVSPDGKLLATSDPTERSILLWDLRAYSGLKTLRAKPRPGGRRPLETMPISGNLPAEDVKRLWDDLAGYDGVEAYHAIWKLATHPKSGVELLRMHLKPTQPVDAKQVPVLLAELDSDDFQTRERASARLRQWAPLLGATLKRALKDSTSLEARRRLRDLVRLADNPAASGMELRKLRAIEVLERADTPEARELLRILAHGAGEAPLTRAAVGALRRLGGAAATKR